MKQLHRDQILGTDPLPDAQSLLLSGKQRAEQIRIQGSTFNEFRKVACEAEFKNAQGEQREVMIHSQIGYRDPAKTKQAWKEIWEKANEKGSRVDRYGICLDWSMGFRPEDRKKQQKGTGLILRSNEEFAELTSIAPVAAHFGDFVMGMPAAVDNTVAALEAGSTAIGNLGQYFTFRLPGHHDDIGDTAATLEALALAASRPEDILIHSNLDDGFAALFTDLSCSLGAVLLEQYIVDDLIGGKISHCYGHSFSEPFKRLVFQLALEQVANNPGTMVYGNTVAYKGDGNENYAALASYLSVDIAAQKIAPSGHAINPVPITEAVRIPDIDEVVDAVVFAGRMIERVEGNEDIFAFDQANQTATKLIKGARQFEQSVLAGLDRAGVDIKNPYEMLLALRRIGAKRLETEFGPGEPDPTRSRGRTPILLASTIAALEQAADKHVEAAPEQSLQTIASAGLTICVCTSDVHEYGKILLTEVLSRLKVNIVDGGVHAEPADIASLSKKADGVAISTYNGVALDYLVAINEALDNSSLDIPVLIGGKTNQIPAASNTSLPVDVSQELRDEGALVCRSIDDLVPHLVRIAESKNKSAE